MLKIDNLYVAVGGAKSWGSTSRSMPAKCTRSWDRTARERARWPTFSPGGKATTSPPDRFSTRTRPTRSRARGAGSARCLSRLPVPCGDPGGVHQHLSPPGSERASTAANPNWTRCSSSSWRGTRRRALGIGDDMLKRAVNAGFSGGEKKRNEVLQMALLQPRPAILDETDSGLDIDALRTVADGVNALRSPDRAMLIITHYQRLLRHIVPDYVHVLAEGRIVAALRREGFGGGARARRVTLATPRRQPERRPR